MKLGVSGLALVALVAAGCGPFTEKPSQAEPEAHVPPLVEASQDVGAAASFKVPGLRQESTRRAAHRMTLRVRNVSCEGVATGSAVAVGDNVLITNRHVLAGADRIEINTWDGRSLEADTAAVGVLGDLGVVEVDEPLPRAGRFGKPPSAGEVVTVVGYPGGGALTLSRGTVVDRRDGGALGIPGIVMRLTAAIEPGSSGGPVLDQAGRIVGVIYAVELSSGLTLAIPVDTLDSLARVAGFEAVPACGEE